MAEEVPFMKEIRVEHLRLKRNCFICLHFRHMRMYNNNPLNFISRDYCYLKQCRNEDCILERDYCYQEHECCLYDPHKLAIFDADLQKAESQSQLSKLYESKYEDPLL